MTASSETKPPAGAQPDLRIVRTFEAPRELVFAAFTEPKHLVEWWGPNGFTTPSCEVDAREGGSMRVQMCGPDGTMCPTMLATYREFVPPERLVMFCTLADQSFDLLQSVTLHERDGKTELTLEVFVLRSTPQAADSLEGMEQGWSETLDRLGAFVQSGDRA